MADRETKESGPFKTELLKAQYALLTFIIKLIGNIHTAEDLLQDVNVKLFKEKERFDPGRPFLPWARAVARFEVLSWRKRQSRSRVIFSDEMVERLSTTFAVSRAEDKYALEERLAALEACRAKLPQKMRILLERYYLKGEDLSSIADSLHRSYSSVANSLYYIRGVLHACMMERLQ